MRKTLLALLTAAAVAAAPATASARLPRLFTGGHPQFAVRPSAVGYTGDGTGFLGGIDATDNDWGHLRWKLWTHWRAYAVGVDWLNDCDPSCAEGTFHAHRARVLATRVRHSKFTRLKIRYRWGSRVLTDRRALRGIGRGRWSWDII